MGTKPKNPMSQSEVIERYFLEHRAKVLDIAAFLDRVDRCESEEDDFRMIAIRACIEELLSNDLGRAERILLLLSDQTNEPIDKAGMKGASGAPPPE
jgi:hypothetical protein